MCPMLHLYVYTYTGMIEPNMATMLSYIVTDLAMSRDQLDSILRETVDVSYNTISVDGDQSTSDTGKIYMYILAYSIKISLYTLYCIIIHISILRHTYYTSLPSLILYHTLTYTS